MVKRSSLFYKLMISDKTTPMMKQYLSIKKNYPDALLLYRMGDFYEMFFDDAKKASLLLEIILTSRNKNDSEPIPMCGFPHRSAHNYITKLINAGCKVALCDQIGTSSKGKGLVERKVVKMITPGMIIDDDMLDGKMNNFILAISYQKQKYGFSFLDISTGDFFVTEFLYESEVVDEILRIIPSEILIPESFKNKLIYTEIKKFVLNNYISLEKNIFFDYETACKALQNQFNILSLNGLGCGNMYSGISAAGALIKYINKTQKQELEHLKFIKSYSLNDFLLVDSQSCKNLELFDEIARKSKKHTLISIIDNTVTSMGGRLLNTWMRYPLINSEQIQLRHEAVFEALEKTVMRTKIREILTYLPDLERLVSKISVDNANTRDLIALSKSIQIMPKFFKVISSFNSVMYQHKNNFEMLSNLGNLINESIREDAPPGMNEGGIIKYGFNKKLDEFINTSRNTKKWIIDLETKEKNLTSINSLKIRYNKIFGYYIEISKRYSNLVPANYICKQTLAKIERYTTRTLRDLEYNIITSEKQRNSLELEIFNKIIFEVKKHTSTIQLLANFISLVDCLTNLASVAHKNDYCKPTLNSEGSIKIEEGRHPVIEKLVDGEVFVPNSIEMDNIENQVIIITGPNMAGKSTILRQTALCIIMAQMGSFVPAKKANIPITDKIFTRIGALDNLSAGQSTFMVEMQETANILNNSTENSLVIVDEIGRGTSTLDGLSIAWAVAEHLHDLDSKGVKSMFATHYHELTTLEKYKPRAKNFTMAAEETENKIIFMRKLVRGSTNKSYGIQVARLSGMPESIIRRSKEILAKLNSKNCSLYSAADSENTKIKHYNNKDENKIAYNSDYSKYQETIISMIKNADILRMNPIDALNYLNDLQIKAKLIPQSF